MPIVRTVGIDPVLFGVVTSIIVTMGILTPPVGIAMYIVNGILGVKMSEYLKESIPFFVVVILVGILLLAIPDVILFLPNLVYGVAS
jgi:TRAP-type C4-dicarboxylate transport system permease large subunit